MTNTEQEKKQEKKRVLIVDDQAHYREQAKVQLANDYDLQVLDSVRAAAEVLKTGQFPDYAIFDGYMPVENKDLEERIFKGMRRFCRTSRTEQGLANERQKGLTPVGPMLVTLYESHGVPSAVLSAGEDHHSDTLDSLVHYLRHIDINQSPCSYHYTKEKDEKNWKEHLEDDNEEGLMFNYSIRLESLKRILESGEAVIPGFCNQLGIENIDDLRNYVQGREKELQEELAGFGLDLNSASTALARQLAMDTGSRFQIMSLPKDVRTKVLKGMLRYNLQINADKLETLY